MQGSEYQSGVCPLPLTRRTIQGADALTKAPRDSRAMLETVLKFDQVGDERAVGGVHEWEEFALGLELEARMGAEEFLNDVFVFFGFQAAGAVDEGAAGLDVRCGLAQKVKLGGAQAVDFFGANAPAEVHAAAHDAGVGAGGID